jgi:tetratricopeptide (TPR) repeat protein
VTHRSRLFQTLLTLLFVPCLAAAPVHAGAQVDAPPETICEPVLVPLDDLSGVRLVAVTLDAEIACPEGACVLRSAHAYRLRNTAPQGTYVRLGLRTGSAASCRADPEIAMVSGDVAVPYLGPTDEYAGTWQVALGAGASVTLSWGYERSIDARLVDWWWHSSFLAPWGEVEGARAELRLPDVATDDALLEAQPHAAGFDGRRLAWSYERASALPDHGVLMVAPPDAARLGALRAAGEGAALGRLLLELRTEAARRGRATPDWDAEIAATLSAAVRAAPEDAGARLNLAEYYRQRADVDPDSRLNYVLLALAALEEAHRLAPDDTEVLAALSRAHYQAALASSESGDPAGALAYLRQAEALGGPDLAPEFHRSEELLLRWALGLAREGRVREAFAEVADRLSPETMDALLHYAPPITAMRTAVALAPGERRVRYDLWPYPPVASATLARVTEIAHALQGVGGSQVALEGDETRLTLHLAVPYTTIGEIEDRHALLREALALPADLLSEIVLAPLRGEVREYAVSHRPFRDLLVYRERTAYAEVLAAWEAEAEYAGWRLVELNAAAPADPRARLEQQMALAALREQAAVWECVPMGAHAAYALAPLEDGTAPDESWLVAWGDDREIAQVHSTWHWPRVLGAAGAPLLLAVLLLAGSRRRRPLT